MVAFTASLLAALASTASAHYAYASVEPSVSSSTPAASYPSGYPLATPSHAPGKDCEKLRSDCQSKPDPNQSFCASQYVACTGVVPPEYSPAPHETTVDSTIYTTVCPETTPLASSSIPTHYPVATPSLPPLGGAETTPVASSSTPTSYPVAMPSLPPLGGAETTPVASNSTPTNYPVATPILPPLSDCQIKYNKCRNGEDGGDRNLSKCEFNFSQCKGAPSYVPSYPAGNPPPPAQTYTPTMASGTPAPNATAPVPFTGSASTLKAGVAGLSGLVALVFLL